MGMRTSSPRRATLGLAVLLAFLTCVAVPTNVEARASGGYARPTGSSRTPSFGGGGGYRTPSTSGGYSRAAPSYGSTRSWTAPQSPGDRSFSQGRSSSALDSYRAQQDNAQRQRAYAPTSRAAPDPYVAQPRQYGAARAPDRSGWFNDRGYSAPPQGYFGGNRSFGAWNGFFLGMLLSNLGRSGSADFFHNNQNDAGYRQWRAEADQQARDNVDLRQKLDELDSQLAQRADEPRTPGALPSDIPPEVAVAPPTRTPSLSSEAGGSVWVWVVLLAGGGAIAYLAYKRRPATGGTAVPSGVQTAANLLRHKLSGETYTPSKFRVGMTMALDPTPFILAAGSIKVPQPQGSGQVSVSAVGHVVSGNTQLVRLYLPDGRGLVQLHLDPAGDPDECRLFGTIDEITPADPNEWGAWLDPAEGMIGWPEFQTKDGKTYARVWVPGGGRISPRELTETIEDLGATGAVQSRVVQSRAMLYAAPTGVADPAPATEYIMVEAVQDGGRAWVAVRAGIDLNPVTLQLA